MKENLVDVMNSWLDSRLDDVHTVIPGKIVEYSGHSERKAKVQPLVKLRTSKNIVTQIEPIENVPVIFPSSSSFNMLYPLKKDDGVLLVFSEASIGNFLAQEGVQDADDANRFDLTDCIAIPGLWSFKTVPDISADDDGFTLQFQDTKIFIEADSNNLQVEDKNGNIVTLDDTGIIIQDKNNNTITMDDSGMVLEDLNGNTVEMGVAKVTINGNLEVLQ